MNIYKWYCFENIIFLQLISSWHDLNEMLILRIINMHKNTRREKFVEQTPRFSIYLDILRRGEGRRQTLIQLRPRFARRCCTEKCLATLRLVILSGWGAIRGDFAHSGALVVRGQFAHAVGVARFVSDRLDIRLRPTLLSSPLPSISQAASAAERRLLALKQFICVPSN